MMRLDDRQKQTLERASLFVEGEYCVDQSETAATHDDELGIDEILVRIEVIDVPACRDGRPTMMERIFYFEATPSKMSLVDIAAGVQASQRSVCRAMLTAPRQGSARLCLAALPVATR